MPASVVCVGQVSDNPKNNRTLVISSNFLPPTRLG
jgi:hypothetical protein